MCQSLQPCTTEEVLVVTFMDLDMSFVALFSVKLKIPSLTSESGICSNCVCNTVNYVLCALLWAHGSWWRCVHLSHEAQPRGTCGRCDTRGRRGTRWWASGADSAGEVMLGPNAWQKPSVLLLAKGLAGPGPSWPREKLWEGRKPHLWTPRASRT